jgi:L-iditol 2-dehydrogenase
MQAMVLTEYGRLELNDRPTPSPAADEVLIRVAACGICGSDVHGYDGSSGRRIPPIVMGHEAAGTVVSTGSGADRFKAGDRVTFDSTVCCGACSFCARGEINLCDRREVVGVSCGEYRRDGAFAEYIAVPERIVYPIPDNLSFAEAAMLEPASVALHAVGATELGGGETALVVGSGMIGLLTMQAAFAGGCSRVFVADVDASRLEMARAMGATEVIPHSGPALVQECLRLTGGVGVDVAFEAVGRDETVNVAIDATRKGGTITLIGNVTPEVKLPLQKVVSRELRLQGTAASAGEYPQAIALISAGLMRVKPLITEVAQLSDGPRWFDRLHAREPSVMKVVLVPSNEASG